MNEMSPLLHSVARGIFMVKGYCIYFSGMLVGEAQICCSGLYYQVRCCCEPPGKDIYRLIAIGNNQEYDLGICMLANQKLSVNKNIPASRFTISVNYFELRRHNAKNTEQFIPLKHNGEFLFIRKLLSGKLGHRGDETGIIFDN